MSASFAQSHARPTAVRIDEPDTGGFQGRLDGREVAGVRHVGSAFEIGDRAPRGAGGLGKGWLRPVQQPGLAGM